MSPTSTRLIRLALPESSGTTVIEGENGMNTRVPSGRDVNLEEKTISTERVFEGKMIKLRVDTVALPNGSTTTREVIEHPGAVAVIALTEQGELLMVRQYRHATGEILLEIPAGKRDRGESPLSCARRELEEETGCRARQWKTLFSYFSTPGFSDELLYIIMATGLEQGVAHTDDEEFIEVATVPVAEALRMIYRGEIRDAKTIIGILVLSRIQQGCSDF
jgi:ADP-ribose pyrophosphatase